MYAYVIMFLWYINLDIVKITMLNLDIRETGFIRKLDIREKKGGPLDSLIFRFDCKLIINMCSQSTRPSF
jgi:hypothetical protein